MFTPATPFGGYKMSGQGRELGEFGLEQYTEKKTVEMSFSLLFSSLFLWLSVYFTPSFCSAIVASRQNETQTKAECILIGPIDIGQCVLNDCNCNSNQGHPTCTQLGVSGYVGCYLLYYSFVIYLVKKLVWFLGDHQHSCSKLMNVAWDLCNCYTNL